MVRNIAMVQNPVYYSIFFTAHLIRLLRKSFHLSNCHFTYFIFTHS